MRSYILLFSNIVLPLALLTGCNALRPTPGSDPALPEVEAATAATAATETPWPATPTRPPDLMPSPTDTPELPPTHTPTPFPTPSVDSWLIADFQTCFNMGGVGLGQALENYLDFSCVPGAGRGNIIVQLDYEIPTAWAGFRISLNEADFSTYDTLTFFARGDAEVGLPAAFKLEIKRANSAQVAIYNLAGLSEEWEQYAIPLQDFRTPPDKDPICSWEAMEELVLIFEKGLAGTEGSLFLDNIYIESRAGKAPEAPASCPPVTSATPMPTTPLPSGPAPVLMVADFCSGTNNLGGAMGAAYGGGDSLAESYGSYAGRDCAARLEYNIQAWAAFWMKLQGQDLTSFSRLLFDIRGDSEAGIPGRIKIELKRANGTQVSIAYVSNITTSWQTRAVSLASFQPTGFPNVAPLSAWTNMEELTFTFEADGSGNSGLIYLDQVRFQP
jgi:hypothetical protein